MTTSEREVTVFPLGDDAEAFIAPGWVDRSKFRRAVAAWTGDDPPPLREIEHAWCREEEYTERPEEGPFYRYHASAVKGAYKATWWML